MVCIFFTPLFTVVYFVEQLILDNLCAKQGDLSIPWPKTAVYDREGSNQERVIMKWVW